MILPLKCPTCGNEIEINYDDSRMTDEKTRIEMIKAYKELGIVNIQDEEENT